MSNILSLSEVAKILGVNRETARRWAVSKLIPGFKIHARGHWQFRSDEIERLLKDKQARKENGHGAV